MKCRLLVTDFDYTLYGGEDIPQSTVDTIKRFQKSGGIFAICTGRMLPSILPHAKKMGLTGDIAASQGAVIYSLDRDEHITRGGISAELAGGILKYAETAYTNVHIYINDKIYVNYYDEKTRIYEQSCGINVVKINGKLSEFVKETNETLEKILIANFAEDNENCYLDLEKKFGGIAEVVTSSPYLVEIISRDCTKGKALEYLANLYNIPIEHTIAIGDSLNDVSMLKAAGLGIAVANATDRVKANADEITVSCYEKAVEKTIKKYGLGEDYE